MQFVPRNGAYVYVREYRGKKVLVILNGVNRANEITLEQYQEALGGPASGRDVLTGKTVVLNEKLALQPRETLLIELE